MKKYMGFVLLGVLLFTASSSKAQDATTASATPPAAGVNMFDHRVINNDKMQAEREALKTKLETERETFKKEVQTKKEEFKKIKDDNKNEFRNNALKMISENFDSAVKNIEKLQARVTAVIAKAKLAGIDTTLTEAALADSKTKLNASKAKLAEVKALILTDGTKITADIFVKIKIGAREAKDLLKQARQELVHAVAVLKGMNNENKVTPTVAPVVVPTTTTTTTVQ